MDPPDGLASDRDKQLVLRTDPILALQLNQSPPHPIQSLQHSASITHQQQQQQVAAAATSPATAALLAAVTGSGNAATMPALATAATTYSAATQAATAFSGTSVGHHHPHHHHGASSQTAHHGQQQHHPHHSTTHGVASQQNSSASSSLLGGLSGGSTGQQQTIEKLSRPMAFDKMESLVREMQDPEHGVPVRQQKMFLTSIPYAFMGYDLIEWLMDRLLIEESEALNIANQLCLHGYFFPVNDSKTLTVKDDSSLYRFQTPYYWPWQHKAPDNVEYAIYLAKRSLRNKQRHALEDYEAEALASLHKNLKGKWDFISMQAEEQVRLAKERKKGDKIVGDSQERAYWRVHRPPPGQFTPLEPCPVPSRDRQGAKPNKKKTIEDVQREVDYLTKSLNRTRMKMSQACESLVAYSETFTDYDFFLQPVLPSNPWVTEDVTFWHLNNTFVDIPTEKRVKRWAISIEELVSDPTGLQEFTTFLEKEYSHENIRFWIAVNRLRRSAHSQVARKVNEIYEEFLKPGAPCEINIDGKTMESVLKGLKNPSRFTFDSASEHIYMLLLKKDCYPRFIRSDHYKRLLESGIQPSHKKRFFNFGGVSGAKKKMTAALSGQQGGGAEGTLTKGSGANMSSSVAMIAPPPSNLARRRGSDRSLTGSAHELAVIGVNKDNTSKVPHSHSQSNLSEMPYSCESIYRGDMPQLQQHQHQQQYPYHQLHKHQQEQQYPYQPHRQLIIISAAIADAGGCHDHCLEFHQETSKPKPARLETTVETSSSAVCCPWDMPDEPPATQAPLIPAASSSAAVSTAQVKLSVCPWEQDTPEPSPPAIPSALAASKGSAQRHTSTSSDITDVSERLQRNLGIRHQNTVDSGEAGIKRLIPNFTEQRRASVSFTPSRVSEYQFGRPGASSAKTSTTPSPTVGSQIAVDSSTFMPLFAPLQAKVFTAVESGLITKDPPSSSDAEIDDELNKLSISECKSESLAAELPVSPTPTPVATPTPPPTTKITPPPPLSIEEDQNQIFNTDAVRVCEEDIADNSEKIEPIEQRQTESVLDSETTQCAETEIEPLVEEVKIELIETVINDDNTLKLLEVATLTLDTQEPSKKLENTAEKNVDITKTPTKVRSARQSPEKDLTITTVISITDRRNLSTSSSTSAIEAPLPSPPLPSPPPPPRKPPAKQQIQHQQEMDDDEEEEQYAGQEELSPTTDEYQEGLQFGADSKDVYEYDIVDMDTSSRTGYIAPAPTPAPSMAPLAELDVDTVDDEPCDESTTPCNVEAVLIPPTAAVTSNDEKKAEPLVAAVAVASATTTTEEVKKRRRKRNSDGKKMTSLEDKDKDKASTSASAASDTDRNAVCPWEDENITTSDGTFVKTYATLGYL